MGKVFLMIYYFTKDKLLSSEHLSSMMNSKALCLRIYLGVFVSLRLRGSKPTAAPTATQQPSPTEPLRGDKARVLSWVQIESTA